MMRPTISLLGLLGVGCALLLPGAASAQSSPPEVATREVLVTYIAPDTVTAPLMLDQLAESTLLTIRAHGFDADTTGSVQQCTVGAVRQCRNALPVRFDDVGHAAVQYLVTAAGECRLDDDRCTVEIRSDSKVAQIETVFVDAAPPLGVLTVSPPSDLRIGDSVTVTASGLPAGTDIRVTVCAAPATSGSRCGAPAPELAMTVGADGSARAPMALDLDEVGDDRIACGRRARCHVVLQSDANGVRALPVDLDIDRVPGPAYDGSRLALGLPAALVMAVAALAVVRRTDWGPPAEADSRAIDDAEYADLDLEAERFEEDAVRSG